MTPALLHLIDLEQFDDAFADMVRACSFLSIKLILTQITGTCVPFCCCIPTGPNLLVSVCSSIDWLYSFWPVSARFFTYSDGGSFIDISVNKMWISNDIFDYFTDHRCTHHISHLFDPIFNGYQYQRLK